MTLLSLIYLEATVGVINWPDFNIVVSQRIGRPGERERHGGKAWVEQSGTQRTFMG